MSSAAEKLTAGLGWTAFTKSKDLKSRLWFTFFALLVYRFGSYVPIPGIDPVVLGRYFTSQQSGLLGVFNIFSGGAISRMAVFSLSLIPYISASIIIQLLTSLSPHLIALKKDGGHGRRKLNQYTRYLTVFLALSQSYGVALKLDSIPHLVLHAGWFFYLTTIVTLVSGTLFLMWLGEQITARGVGNGTSLIIFAGIVAQLPTSIALVLSLGREGALPGFLLLALFVMIVFLIIFVVFMERAQRRLVVQYPKRQSTNKMYGGERSHLPIKLNVSGVIPPIFASSLLLVPITLADFISSSAQSGSGWLDFFASLVGRGHLLYMVLYVALIVFFAFFYTAVVFDPTEVADNLKKNGGFILGLRPGKKTAEYLDYVLTRLTVVGALYLAFVCLVPELFISKYNLPFALGGTSILIIVSVVMDTIAQIQGYLMAQQYESLIRKSRLRKDKRR